jgi:hypothetical protein
VGTTSRRAVTVCPAGIPAANSCMAVGSGGCHACVHTWSEAGSPSRPVLPTPWTLKLRASPSSFSSLPAFTVTLVVEAGKWSSGGRPMKPVRHEEPMTFQDVAGAKQFGPAHGAQLTSHPPWPSALVVTYAGADGPCSSVVKSRGSDGVDWLLIYAVTTAW